MTKMWIKPELIGFHKKVHGTGHKMKFDMRMGFL